MTPPSRRISWWVGTALTATVGLRLLRVFMATTNFYVVDARGFHPVVGGVLALAVFVVAVGLARIGHSRRATTSGAVLLALAAVAEQVVRSPGIDLLVAALGTITFLFVLTLLLRGSPGSTGVGLLVGVALDLAMLGSTWTLDLSWIDGGFPLLVTVILAGALVAASAGLAGGADEPAPGRFWVVGPWLMLQMVVYGNIGFVGSATGLGLPAAWMVTAAAAAIGVAVATRAKPGRWSAAVLGAVLVGATATLTMASGPALAVALLAGQTSAALVLLTALRGGGRSTSGGAGAGLAVMVVMLFLYYGSYQFDMGFRSSLVVSITAGLPALGAAMPAVHRVAPVANPAAPARTAVALVIPALAVWLVWSPPGFVQGEDPGGVRIMSYNVHQGFSTAGVLDIEAIARVIESEAADIVALQEVSRGWVVNGSLDVLAWLSNRLGMPYVFGPSADGQWGNAVLSRYPIVASRTIALPPRDLPLRRSYLDVTIAVAEGNLRVLATHLHHVPGDEAVRGEQAERLLAAWDRSPRTVLVGDLNATPDSRPIRILLGAGLNDAGFGDGVRRFTYPAGDPRRTIDYILTSPDLVAGRVSVPANEASDHLPVTVTLGE